jgi:sensor histidine kinase regulating citrate/malate metabolism
MFKKISLKMKLFILVMSIGLVALSIGVVYTVHATKTMQEKEVKNRLASEHLSVITDALNAILNKFKT